MNFIFNILFNIKLIYFINKLKKMKMDFYVFCLNKRSNNKINFVEQGWGGLTISSQNGDLSNFKIHWTSHLKSATYIDCSGGVSIGRYFHTGRGLTIFSTNHNYKSEISIPYDDKTIFKPVFIGDFVWCGSNVTIVPGVEIGEGVVIGSGAVVTSNIPPYAIIGGNPAKILKYRDIDLFKQLKSQNKFF